MTDANMKPRMPDAREESLEVITSVLLRRAFLSNTDARRLRKEPRITRHFKATESSQHVLNPSSPTSFLSVGRKKSFFFLFLLLMCELERSKAFFIHPSSHPSMPWMKKVLCRQPTRPWRYAICEVPTNDMLTKVSQGTPVGQEGRERAELELISEHLSGTLSLERKAVDLCSAGKPCDMVVKGTTVETRHIH